MNKVFLGGTCAESTWREELMSLIQVNFFNPVVDDWTPDCQEIEVVEKNLNCNIHLYVITSDMLGTFSIAEAIESSMTCGKQTILHIIPGGFGQQAIKSFKAVCDMVVKHGGIAYIDEELARTAGVINYCYK